MPRARPPGAPLRLLEPAALGLAAAGLGAALVATGHLLGVSDPSLWYRTGRDFPDSFATSGLAYGFPLLVAGAIAGVGPIRAYLVNLPVLVAMVVLVYVFARQHAGPPGDGAAPWRAPAAACALLALVGLDAPLLRQLLSPYRDPLAHALLLGACVLAVSTADRRDGGWRPAAAGALLGLAVSTREASVLALGPLAVFAVVARLRDPALPFARPLLGFALAFAVACIPLLVQNAVYAGNPFVPSQAARSFAESGSLTPGVRPAFLAETLPAVLARLRNHYGLAGLGLVALGAVAGLRRRGAPVVALSLPALAVYLLFYGSYVRPVPRYLFVLDLFALPVAAGGLAALLERATRPLPRARVVLARVVLVGALVGSVLAALRGALPEEERFTLEHARAIREVAASLPREAAVFGEHPFIVLVETFAPRPLGVEPGDLRPAALRDPAMRALHRERIARAPEVLHLWLAGDEPVDFTVRPLLRETRDLVRVHPPPDVPLAEGDIVVERAVPWSRRKTTVPVSADATGPHWLLLDAGRLSALPRSGARVVFGDRTLDEPPHDGPNDYRVDVDDAPVEIPVGLVSDGSVPARPPVRLVALERPLHLDFEENGALAHYHRFSPSFFEAPRLPRPTLAREGRVAVPTPGPPGNDFVVVAGVTVDDGREVHPHRVEIRSAGTPLHAVAVPGDRPWRLGGHRYTVSFVVPGELSAGATTPLDWRVTGPPEAAERPVLGLRWLRVHRVDRAAPLDLILGGEDDGAHVVRGVHARDAGPGADLPGRWTSGEARLRVFTPLAPAPQRLSVSYRIGVRPDAPRPPRPVFSWNGSVLGGRTSVEPLGDGQHRVTRHFDLWPGAFRPRHNVLAIRTEPTSWARPSADGALALGIRLERVRLAPRAASARE